MDNTHEAGCECIACQNTYPSEFRCCEECKRTTYWEHGAGNYDVWICHACQPPAFKNDLDPVWLGERLKDVAIAKKLREAEDALLPPDILLAREGVE